VFGVEFSTMSKLVKESEFSEPNAMLGKDVHPSSIHNARRPSFREKISGPSQDVRPPSRVDLFLSIRTGPQYRTSFGRLAGATSREKGKERGHTCQAVRRIPGVTQVPARFTRGFQNGRSLLVKSVTACDQT
jgi:hypothetical protein